MIYNSVCKHMSDRKINYLITITIVIFKHPSQHYVFLNFGLFQLNFFYLLFLLQVIQLRCIFTGKNVNANREPQVVWYLRSYDLISYITDMLKVL